MLSLIVAGKEKSSTYFYYSNKNGWNCCFGATEELKDAIKRLREQALRDARGEKEAIEEQRRQRQYKQEIKHEEAKLEIRQEFERKLQETREKSLRRRNQETKLPKLVITMFEGTHLDWHRSVLEPIRSRHWQDRHRASSQVVLPEGATHS